LHLLADGEDALLVERVRRGVLDDGLDRLPFRFETDALGGAAQCQQAGGDGGQPFEQDSLALG